MSQKYNTLQNAKYRLSHLQNVISSLYVACESAKLDGDRETRRALQEAIEKTETSYYKLWDKVYIH